MRPKGHVGYPRGTRPPSSIVELSTCPVFDHREKGTFKVYPWLPRMLFKGQACYPQGTRPTSSIIESSTHPISSRKRNFQSPPLDAPCPHQESCGLSRGTWPLSSIIKSSSHTVFDHCEKGTLKVCPYLRCVLFKGYAGYSQETQTTS